MARVPRNIYNGEIDFTALALQYPNFARKYVAGGLFYPVTIISPGWHALAYRSSSLDLLQRQHAGLIQGSNNSFNVHHRLKSNRQLDFSDPEAVRQLTKSLLHRDFAVEIDLPEDRLCPPVPNRLNYIFWVQDLLDTTSDGYGDQYDRQREVTGLDIGTGASAIYPLLGCRLRERWKFVGTEIDEKSLQYAHDNINRNDLSRRVKVLATNPEAPLVPQVVLEKIDNIDFTMCNPPFYTSIAELLHSASVKSRPPHSSCTGSAVEMVVPGGEVAFTERLISESLKQRGRVQWYTTMLGKLSSVQTLVERLIEVECGNYAVTEFVQRGKTKRWGLGWSWQNVRPRMGVTRGIPGFPKHLLPFPSETNFSMEGGSPESIGQNIDAVVRSLDLQWQWRSNISTGVGFALSNAWSRQARRKKAQHHDQVTVAGPENEGKIEEHAALGFKISVTRVDGKNEVMVRWLKGTDAVVFESFCGMLKRKLQGR